MSKFRPPLFLSPDRLTFVHKSTGAPGAVRRGRKPVDPVGELVRNLSRTFRPRALVGPGRLARMIDFAPRPPGRRAERGGEQRGWRGKGCWLLRFCCFHWVVMFNRISPHWPLASPPAMEGNLSGGLVV